MNIDWSKAPDGATHYRILPESGLLNWYRKEDSTWQWSRSPLGWSDCLGKEPEGKVLPISEVWTGEGLPPVGTVCEFAGFNPEETMPTDPRVGDQVTVIAHFMSGSFEVAAFTFYAPPEFEYLQVAQGAYGCFRPIRTPEQIASEDREKAVRAMGDAIKQPAGSVSYGALYDLYDAGYRKFEIVEGK